MHNLPQLPCHFVGNSSPQAQPTYGFRTRPLPPIDRYSYVGGILLKATSNGGRVVHPKRQHAMAEEIDAREHTCTWDLISLPKCGHPITCKWSTRLRIMVLLSVTKLVVCPVAFSWNMVMTTMRHFLMWPT